MNQHQQHQMLMSSHDQMMHGGQMMHMGNLKQKFWNSLFLAVPILFMAPAMGLHLPFQFQFAGSDILVVLLATILFIYGGSPFLKGAVAELKARQPEMMTLISLGIVTAYGYSLYAFIHNNVLHQHPFVMDFFWELATLILIMLLGHWLEMNSMMQAQQAVNHLASLLPAKAHVLQNGRTHDVSLQQVAVGAKVVVRAGEAVPLDGQVISGHSEVNESLVTGESQAVQKNVNDTVVGGSLNGSKTLTIKVTQAAGSGFVANVNHLVQKSQQNKSQLQTWAQRVAGWLFYAALVIGFLALLVWSIISDVATGIQRLVTVLVIACPHALGLAIPLVNARSTALGSRHGILIQRRQVIEESAQIDYVVFDKTGTLTQGQFQVIACRSLSKEYDQSQILQIIGSLESQSNHPIAQSVRRYLKKQQQSFKPAQNVQTLAGGGLAGQVATENYQLLSPRLATQKHLQVPTLHQSETTSFLVHDQQIIGYLIVGDQLRSTAKKMITAIKDQKLTPVMLTGDNSAIAAHIAKQLGIQHFKAELQPQAKQQIIVDLQKQGHQVMMVGDGVNDAPSLAQANIGVAFGAGTDVALDAADVILVNSEPLAIIQFLKLARRTRQKTLENLWWGAGYNIIALPLAAGVLAFAGIVLSPALGALLMSLSTVIVALNAASLRL